MNKEIHKGQVALVLVLIMTVVSALAVSLASRSTVDTKIQETESEGVQALISAQTGLEQMIVNPTGSIKTDNYEATKTDEGINYVDVGRVESGASVEINIEDSLPGLTGFSVSWGPDKANPSDTPAVLVSLVETSGAITDFPFAYTDANNFTAASAGSGGYAKTTGTISLEGYSSKVIKIRITVLGAAALVKVDPVGAVFPSQIKSIKSTGSVVSDSKTVKYGLQYDESAQPGLPAVFDYALFSGGGIIQ